MRIKEVSNLVIDNRDFKDGNEVATLISETYITPLYANKNKGLHFFEDGKTYYLKDMISKSDYERVLNAIDEFMFSDDLTKMIKILF